MAGVDRLQAMTCFAFLLLLLAVVHAQAGQSKLEEHFLSAGGEQGRETPRRGSEEEFVPVQSVVYRSVAAEKVSSDPPDTCHECRCCSSSNKSNCVQTQCCFSIKCKFPPGEPYGVCVGSPVRCGCDPNNTCDRSLPSSSHSSEELLLV